MKQFLAVIASLTLIATACQRSTLTTDKTTPVAISATIEGQAPAKHTATAFAEGDQLGLFVTKAGQELQSSGNAVDNARLVSSSSIITGNPPLYYPDPSSRVDLFSYYPYQPGIANALEVFFGIRTNQAVFSSYLASDLCYGSKIDVTPSMAAQPITYRHSMSQLNINIDAPASVGGQAVASVSSVRLLSLFDGVKLNLSNGAAPCATTRSDVVMYGQSATLFSAIVPAQQLRVGSLAVITIVLDDRSTKDYLFNIDSPLELVGGSANTLNLKLTDHGTIAIDGQITISAWSLVDRSATITEPVANQFTLLWRLPNRDYRAVSSVELKIFDPKSKLVQEFQTTDFRMVEDQSSSTFCIYKFNLVIPSGEGISYPYRVEAISFFNASGDLIQQCDAVIAAMVTRSGAFTMGLEQNYILYIVEGTVTNWNDVSGGGSIGGGVANSFVVKLIEPAFDFVGSLDNIRLKIGGVDYLFPSVRSTGNSLIQTTSLFALPDKNNRVPSVYPYVIEEIGLRKSDNSEIQTSAANLMVTRTGEITLQVYRGPMLVMSSSESVDRGAMSGISTK